MAIPKAKFSLQKHRIDLRVDFSPFPTPAVPKNLMEKQQIAR